MILNFYFLGSDQLQQEPGVENSISTLATAIADRKNTDRKNSETLSQVGDNYVILGDGKRDFLDKSANFSYKYHD